MSYPGRPDETWRTRVTVSFQITSATWRSSSTSTRLPCGPFVRGVGRFAFVERLAIVCGPITPSRPMPAHFWNAIAALNVAASLTPSAFAFSMKPSSTSLRSVSSRLGFAAGFFFAFGAGGPPFGLPSIFAVTGFARSTPGWSVCRTLPFTRTITDFTPGRPLR